MVRYLAATLKSVSHQTHPDWQCVVVANEGAELPDMPAQCEILRIDAPYVPLPPRDADRDAYEAAVRVDKGMRLWRGLNHMEPGGFVMITDYDDFVHRDLAAMVASEPENPGGWYVDTGYLFTEGARILKRRREFNTVCGTSNIVRDSILREPQPGEELDFHIQQRLGSHVFISHDLRRRGIPLKPVPFPGAIYRVGYSESTSGNHGAWRTVIGNIKKPGRFFETISSITPITADIRRDFWGEPAA